MAQLSSVSHPDIKSVRNTTKMEYSFTAWGHENITANHKRTLEFTKDNELSLEGDCILGVSANFSIYPVNYNGGLSELPESNIQGGANG